MCEPHMISSWQKAQRVVNKILVEEQTVAISVKQKYFNKPGELYLIVLGTPSGCVYLFDLRTCPDIIHKGGLWRVLQAPALEKVMHDCRVASSTLATQHGVELNNVFDTQAAYSLLLMEKGLPARVIELHNMYGKFGDASQKFMPMLQNSIELGGIYWAQRPMSKEMIYTVACEVLALHSDMYLNIKNDISWDLLTIFEDLCKAYTTGKYKISSQDAERFELHNSKTPRSARSLRPSEKHLIQGSLPNCAGCNA